MKTKLRAIEHRAVSGIWLLGEDFEGITISEETYNWLWNNIYTICDNSRLIKMFWANSHQHFDYRLPHIASDFDFTKGEIVNKDQIDKRDGERNRFLEFHYALGGLLLYRQQYHTLNYLFEYSQSQPPKYVLLPETMDQIFEWFEYFRNGSRHWTPIDLKYFFPELDNLGNRQQVNYWICSYIVILFIRQYSLQPYFIYHKFTDLPDLPDDVLKLSSWLDSISYFEKCLNNLLENTKLIEDLKFEKLVVANKDSFYKFIHELKEKIKTKIGTQKLNAKLSPDKIQNFFSQSNQIIKNAFEIYKPIFNTKTAEHSKSELKLSVNGGIRLMSKSAFTDKDVTHLNYDTFFADTIATNNIKRYIPNSFYIARTKRYLLNKDNILLGLSKVIGNSNDIIIVGVQVGYQLKEILDESIFKSFIRYIPSTEYQSQDTLFVLRKTDLPAIEHIELMKDEKEELQLECINKDLKLYASVIDINTTKNKAIKSKWSLENELDNEDLKVQLSIAFLSVIYWKNEREIIQLSLSSEFREHGIQNQLKDIEPLSMHDEK